MLLRERSLVDDGRLRAAALAKLANPTVERTGRYGRGNRSVAPRTRPALLRRARDLMLRKRAQQEVVRPPGVDAAGNDRLAEQLIGIRHFMGG